MRITPLQRAATIAFVLHLVAGLAMAIVLRNGLETNPNMQDRLDFLVSHRALWTMGWLTWTAAAIAILYFYMVFASTHRAGDLAVLLTAAAIAPDLAAQAIEIGILPDITQQMDRFLVLHRTAVLLSGYVANGLYSLSALILSWSARQAYPVWVWAGGIAVGCFGFMLSSAALMDSATGMFWTNVFLVPAILLWLGGVAWRGGRS